MTDNNTEQDGVWFVYDGDCPICKMGASMYRVREALGSLHTVDARQEGSHWLVGRVNEAELDLDEGMVIYYAGSLYHGDGALKIMADLAETTGWYNHLHVFLFRHPRIARWCYPLLRGCRNLLLRLRGVGRINNLERQ